MQIFGVIPIIKLQNETQTTVKWWKMMKNEIVNQITYLSCPVHVTE